MCFGKREKDCPLAQLGWDDSVLWHVQMALVAISLKWRNRWKVSVCLFWIGELVLMSIVVSWAPITCPSPSSSLETNSDQLSPSAIKSEPRMIKFESDACVVGCNKPAALKGRKGALASILGGTVSWPLLKGSLMCRPRCCWGGARGARGDKRLSGGPLTPALPREMSEEAAGWQTSRCALKKPWRLAGAYPNLCRRQISPGSPRRLEHSLFWHQINQMQNGRQLGLLWIQRPLRRHLDTITLTSAPRGVSIWRDVKGKEKRGKTKPKGRIPDRWSLIHVYLDPGLRSNCSLLKSDQMQCSKKKHGFYCE